MVSSFQLPSFNCLRELGEEQIRISPLTLFCLPLVRAGTQELDKTEPLGSAAVNRHYTTLDDGDDDMSMGHLWDRKLSSATLFTTNPTFTATELTRVFQDVKMGVL
jgi:hypothetical protein